MLSVFGIIACLLAPAGGQDSFFYAIEEVRGFERLWRIDLDGTMTPIGENTGFPSVTLVAWDSDRDALFGYDSEFAVLLELDTDSGQGQRTLSPLRRKDLHQELVVPAGYFALPFDAVL